MVPALIASFLVMLASLGGKLTTWRLAGPVVERNLHFLVSFAAGVLLVVAYQLTTEVVEQAAGSTLRGIPWIMAGALVILVSFRFLPDFHHHHDAHADDHTHSRLDARRILLSDAIHNIGDGVVIVASFSASFLLGVASTVSILVHETLQEISEFFVLRESGLSTNRALLYNFIVSSTILIGTIGAYFLVEQFEALKAPMLGLAAGSYLVIVFHDLIPHAVTSAIELRHYVKHVCFFFAGVIFMTLFLVYIPEV